MAGEGAQGLQAIAAHTDVVSQVLELLAQQDLVGVIVIDHQDMQPMGEGLSLVGLGRRHCRDRGGGLLSEREGQPYLEPGAFADLAVNGYLPPHHLAQDAGDVEAQPAAGELALAVGAIEGGEEPGQLVRGNAGSGVGDDEVQHRRLLAPGQGGGNGDPALLGELDGVADEIGEDLAQAKGIDQHPWHGGVGQPDLIDQPLLLGHARKDPGDGREQGREIAGGGSQGHLARLYGGDIQAVPQQIQQTVGGVGGDAQQLAAVTAESGILGGQLQHAEDGVHGGADLVAHGGEEVALGAAGAVGLLFGLAQRLFQPLAVRDVYPAVDHPADGPLPVEIGHHPVIDVALGSPVMEEAIRKDGLPLLQYPGKVLLQHGDAACIDHP